MKIASLRSLLDTHPLHWQHLLGLAVRHQCRFVSFGARLNLHAVPSATAKHRVTL